MAAAIVRWAFGLLMLGSAALAQSPPAEITVSIPVNTPLREFGRLTLSEAYRRIGVVMRLEPLPAARSVEMANQGVTDAEGGRVPEAMLAYTNLLRVPEPLLSLDYYAIALDTAPDITRWSDLRNWRLCVQLGDKLVETRTADIPHETVRTLEAARQMLRAGRCDVMVINQFNWLEIARQDFGPFCQGPLLETVHVYHYVNRKHEDMIPRLAAALRELRREGVIDQNLAPVRQEVSEAMRRNGCAATDAARR